MQYRLYKLTKYINKEMAMYHICHLLVCSFNLSITNHNFINFTSTFTLTNNFSYFLEHFFRVLKPVPVRYLSPLQPPSGFFPHKTSDL